jgi:hypothetical protein
MQGSLSASFRRPGPTRGQGHRPNGCPHLVRIPRIDELEAAPQPACSHAPLGSMDSPSFLFRWLP